MEVFVTGNFHSFGNENSNRRMCCSSIGIGIRNGSVIEFCFSFGYILFFYIYICLEIYEALKIDIQT